MSRLHDPTTRSFASDNYAGLHPEVLAAIVDADGGHVPSYGADPYTAELQRALRAELGEHATVWPVLTGTGGNVVALQAVLPRWGAVVCAESAHVHTDENGAPERVGGLKLLTVPTPDGKLTPDLVDRQAWGFGDEHRAQPLAVSITQSTELGTCYTAAEIAAVTTHAHALGMRVHVDGSRIANAAASLGTGLRELLADTGVDVVTLGGTKNGALGAEAVVVLDPEAGPDAHGVRYLRKAGMQLASKMRYVSAQLLALYAGDLWLRNARHANDMARRLAAGAEALDGVRLTRQVQANAVFAVLDRSAADRLRARYRFYDWDRAAGEVRWMCSWDTAASDVDAFVAELGRALDAGSG